MLRRESEMHPAEAFVALCFCTLSVIQGGWLTCLCMSKAIRRLQHCRSFALSDATKQSLPKRGNAELSETGSTDVRLPVLHCVNLLVLCCACLFLQTTLESDMSVHQYAELIRHTLLQAQNNLAGTLPSMSGMPNLVQLAANNNPGLSGIISSVGFYMLFSNYAQEALACAWFGAFFGVHRLISSLMTSPPLFCRTGARLTTC